MKNVTIVGILTDDVYAPLRDISFVLHAEVPALVPAELHAAVRREYAKGGVWVPNSYEILAVFDGHLPDLTIGVLSKGEDTAIAWSDDGK